MFAISNSTFFVSGVHVMMNSKEESVCSIAGSIVRFWDSWITSSSDICPFVIRTSEHEGIPAESTVVLSKIHRLSQTASIGPFVGLADPNAQLASSASADWSDLRTNEMDGITVVGTDLSLESQHLVSRTGPLFSFGMSERETSLAPSGCALRMETSLIRSTLVNMTSSTPFSPNKQLYGSTVGQRVVASCVRKSTNHDSGTGMMSPNLGGNLMCLNTSFSSCIRQTNDDQNLAFSFENRTNTSTPGRFYQSHPNVTSVSFTLCTFEDLTAAPRDSGGAAIYLITSLSSLTILTCFFHNCTLTGRLGNYGGAIFYSYQVETDCPMTVSASSFTECSSTGVSGSIHSYSTLIVMEKCFFELSKATSAYGAMALNSKTITISNTAFVECSTDYYSGTIFLSRVSTLTLSFLQFRGCFSTDDPDGKDIYFGNNVSSEITSDMIQFCDSTSGAPNVYFSSNSTANSDLVPQISSTPTIKSVDVTFDGDEATVTVETEEALIGTMGVLLDGSNVPRLVHVVFGGGTTLSKVGKGIVSSGANGILPSASYSYRKSALAPFPLPTVHSAESTLKDWNTTEIVMCGANLWEGSYWTLVKKENNTLNITLTRSDSKTLVGTAPLYPSSAEGRLEWETEYEVTKVMCREEGEQHEAEIGLAESVTFTTPAEPHRIESVDCSLNGKKDVVVVELRGRKLTSSGQTVVVSGTSGEITSSVELFNVTSTNCLVNFSIGSSEDSSHVVFGGRYELLSVESDSSSFVVNSGLSFSVPHPPRITSIAAPSEVSSSTFVLSVSGEHLPSGSTFTVTLTSGHTFTISYSSATTGTSTIGIGGIDEVQFDTDYSIQSVIRTESGRDDDHILFTSISFRTPLGPTLSSISCDFSSSNPNILNLSLSTARMPMEVFTLTLKTTQYPLETIHLPLASSDISTGFVLVEVYKQTNTLKYGTEYSIVGMSSSSVVAVVTASPFSTPSEPIRITSASCSLGGDQQKSALVKMMGVKLGGGKTFNVTVRKMEGSTLIGVEIVLSGTLSGESSSTTHIVSVLVFGTTNPLLSFGTTYQITRFTVDGSASVVDADVTFSVPSEPSRIVGVEKRQLNKDRTQMIVWLKGRALLSRTGKVSVTNGTMMWESLSDVIVVDETHCTAAFAVGEVETSNELKLGEEYTLRGIWTESNGFHVEDGITLVVPFSTMISHLEFVFSNTLHTSCFVKLTGTDLIVGNSQMITLNDSFSFVATVTSETEARSAELPIGFPMTLQHNTKYTLTLIEAMNEDDGIPYFDSAISNSTGSLPDDVVVFVDSGSSSESSLLCGDRTQPCTSIEDGWTIVDGVGISLFSVSILHSTTQNDQVKMLSHHEVVIQPGPTAKPELLISPSSSLADSEGEEEGMIDVSGGCLWIHQIDIILSDSPSLVFIRMVGGSLTIEMCSLTGHSSSSTSNELATNADLCLWESGILDLVNSTTTIKHTDLTHLSQGAINVKGGNLTIRSSSFDSNTPRSNSFPSLRHNILCSEGGEIELGSLSGGDGMETLSAWISTSDCSLTAKETISRSPFFVPTLSSSTSTKLNAKKTVFEVSMEGTTLIPCSLFLEVFEMQKDGTDGQAIRIALSEDSTESFNETHIEMSLPQSSMSGFDTSLEWCGRLVYGLNETTASFVIQKNTAERITQGMLENMKWWLPLVISLSVLFLIVLGIVIVCCRRRRTQKNEQKDAEMNDSDELPMEDEKEDVVTDNETGENPIDPFSSSKLIIATEKKEPEQSDDLICLKEDILITEERTNMKENTHWTRRGMDTVEVFIGVAEKKGDENEEETKREWEGDEKNRREEIEKVMERPHKKRKKKTTTTEEDEEEEREKEAGMTTSRTEKEDGVEGEDDGNVEGKKKRKKKKKGMDEENTNLLILEELNEDAVNEEQILQGKEGEGTEEVSRLKKKKTKKKKHYEVVEEENTLTEAIAKIERMTMKDELNTMDTPMIADGGERQKRKKKKVEMREEGQEETGETEIVEMDEEEAHYEEEEGTKQKKTKKIRKKRKEESENRKEEDIETEM
ncbi:hypothetical protein BLNAU_12056 [Blattamonas nauphoetae]|uniref:Transmembrane protein n=1 Tax=Blattamonas nauphoetae TaxID=2049346 RepID=A0ABQ9XQW0_9EUKA|nr:hypothetical protein BLNAU_12056 [Blattamonas nauphoetae]